MHRFYLPNPQVARDLLRLDGTEWHHCRTVLRAREGTRASVFDGAGSEYLCEIQKMDEDGADLRVIQKSFTPRPTYSITLAQALPKNKVMDLIMQKATELGVCEIIPVLSERSVIRIEADEMKNKLTRWRDITMEAAKQCGLNWLPTLTKPKTVKEIAETRTEYTWGLIGSLQPEAKPLWEHLKESRAADGKAILMIGPEGDFTPAEMVVARAAGFQPLTLGSLVLRCDTAAIHAISILNYELRRR